MTDIDKINKLRRVLFAAINNTKNGGGQVRNEKAAMKQLLELLLGRTPSPDEISLASNV